MKLNSNVLNFLYIHRKIEEEDIIASLEEVQDYPDRRFILLFSKEHLAKMLHGFPSDTLFRFWIHYELDHPIILNQEEVIKRDFPNLEVHFICNSDDLMNCSADNEPKRQYHKDDSNDFMLIQPEGKCCFAYRAFRNSIPPNCWPKVQRVGQVLSGNIRLQDFSYSAKVEQSKIRLLRLSIDDATMRAILGAVIESAKSTSVEVEVLNSGYSGAHVVKVIPESKDSFIVKLDRSEEQLEKELEVAKRNMYSRLQSEGFIFAVENALKKVFDWFILSYPVAQNMVPLKSIIQQRPSLEKLLDIYQQALKKMDLFAESAGPFTWLDLPTGLWEKCQIANSEEIHYHGLEIGKKGKESLLIQVNKLVDISQKCQEGLEEEHPVFKLLNDVVKNRKQLINYIESGCFKRIAPADLPEDIRVAFLLETSDRALGRIFQKIPVCAVHGDFHTDNIMISRSDKDRSINIIDFELSPDKPSKHAFTDIAKLAVDTEFKMVPDPFFILGDSALAPFTAWRVIHKAWRDGTIEWYKDDKGKFIKEIAYKWYAPEEWRKQFPQIIEAYKMNEFLLIKALSCVFIGKSYEEIQSEDEIKSLLEEMKLQFLMVRLRYLLKMINYVDVLMEKKLFAYLASVDVLEFLYVESTPKIALLNKMSD